MLPKKTKAILAFSAAALIGTTIVTTAGAEEEVGKCVGGNTCHGQSAGETATSKCAGKNACKGQGWAKIDKKTCAERGGKFEPLK